MGEEDGGSGSSAPQSQINFIAFMRTFSSCLRLLLGWLGLLILPLATAVENATDIRQPVRFLMLNVRNYFVAEDVQRAPYPRPIKSVGEREAVARDIASVHPNVVGLIEIGGQAALRDLAARLEKRGLHYEHMFVLERHGEDRALGILSDIPIVRNQSRANYRLVGEKTNRRMLRGILDITLRAPDSRQWRIIGVHLKSRKTNDQDAAAIQREREMHTLAQHVQHALQKEPKLPLLVFGDWNTGPEDPIFRSLTQPRNKQMALHHVKAVDPHGEAWTVSYTSLNEISAYDQIYVSPALQNIMNHRAKKGIVEKPRHSSGSDHRAVWCDLP